LHSKLTAALANEEIYSVEVHLLVQEPAELALLHSGCSGGRLLIHGDLGDVCALRASDLCGILLDHQLDPALSALSYPFSLKVRLHRDLDVSVHALQNDGLVHQGHAVI